MAGRDKSLTAARVVIVSPLGRALLGSGQQWHAGGAEIIAVASPYEAAAELIASPAAALVVDLRLMGPRHLRLLEIARSGGAELLAVGPLPPGMTAEDLSGVRLLARADLPAALLQLLQRKPSVHPDVTPGPVAAGPAIDGKGNDGTSHVGRGGDGRSAVPAPSASLHGEYTEDTLSDSDPSAAAEEPPDAAPPREPDELEQRILRKLDELEQSQQTSSMIGDGPAEGRYEPVAPQPPEAQVAEQPQEPSRTSPPPASRHQQAPDENVRNILTDQELRALLGDDK